jgi:hypothetical protein
MLDFSISEPTAKRHFWLLTRDNGSCRPAEETEIAMWNEIARLQEQLAAVTRSRDEYRELANDRTKAWTAAEARAARLEAALRRISDMCPATQEMTVAHMMADEAEAALDVKEAG